MVESYIFDKLNVLNNIYSNSLPISNDKVYHDTIKTSLYPHQNNMVIGMHKYREKVTIGFLSNNQAINSKIGIIADSPGTGKTLSILAYLAIFSNSYPRMTCELIPYSTKYFFSHHINDISNQSNSNLIIVPHYLYHTWINQIKINTTMKYFGIEKKRKIKRNKHKKYICR